ncbi:MAG: SCO family protein [Bacteroidetes bacterium]|nr:SCO family protein [Bacteroidota bacterium]
MKKYSYIGISFVILVFGIWVVNEFRQRFGQNDNMAVVGPAPKFTLTNQHGKTITPENMKGKVYVVDFFFTSCPSICPVMTENLKEVQNEFYGNPNFGILSVSIDSKFDSPEVLKKYADKHQIKNQNWHFLTGDKEAISTLANAGFNIYVDASEKINGEFQHSGMFALIDKEGNIRSRKDDFGNPIVYYDGLSYADAESLQFKLGGSHKPGIVMLKEDIQKLLKE